MDFLIVCLLILTLSYVCMNAWYSSLVWGELVNLTRKVHSNKLAIKSMNELNVSEKGYNL